MSDGAACFVYIGDGASDLQKRPSIFTNPFFLLTENVSVALAQFESWLWDRADLDEFLRPIIGVTVDCDCNRGEFCHFHVLRRVMDSCYPVDPVAVPVVVNDQVDMDTWSSYCWPLCSRRLGDCR